MCENVIEILCGKIVHIGLRSLESIESQRILQRNVIQLYRNKQYNK